ncbi:ATP-binding protein [Streptomyces monticola]|uniref:ATP-binding protein n=1 Tax=Streptomyces monticola TaxID=2666263 RepID=A0ABW2JM39_9ACTN
MTSQQRTTSATEVRKAPPASQGVHGYVWELPHEPQSCRRARELTRAAASSRRVASDDLVLVVSELIGNALAHGAGPLHLGLLFEYDTIRVAVHDHGAGLPQRDEQQSASEDTCGRGLHIVELLSNKWGVTLTGGHAKTTWAELALVDEQRGSDQFSKVLS